MSSNTRTHDNNIFLSIMHIVQTSNNKITESREFFDNIIDDVMIINNDLTHEHVKSTIFHLSCNHYPKVAIFMIKNSMCTKEMCTVTYDNYTSLHWAIRRAHIDLVKCFIDNIEYFGELLVQIPKYLVSQPILFYHKPPLFSIACIENEAKGVDILRHILKSEHCTEQILKSKYYDDSNIFGYFMERNKVNYVKTLLESEKCTYDVVCCTKSKISIAEFPDIFKFILESEKLPIDYFENCMDIFTVSKKSLNVFLDSPYSNVGIIENYFNNVSKQCLTNDNIQYVNIILKHPKYLHLAEKYNLNGTLKLGYKKIVNYEKCIDKLLDIIEGLSDEINVQEQKIEELEHNRNI